MNNEKLEKTIEFILNNQAQFYADLQQVQETNKQLQELHKYSTKRIGTLERVSLNLYNLSVEQGKLVGELREAQQETDRRFRETDERFKEIGEQFKETDERLNIVILMAEKFFSGENGERGKKSK